MSIDLTKGNSIDLTKGNENLTQLMVGLGWDPIKKRGLFGSVFSGASLDCDAFVLMLQDDRLVKQQDIVSFRKQISDCGSVRHSGDNLTGSGEGDDEQILVNLDRIPSRINRLIFCVNIYSAASRGQDFGMVENAFIRIVDQQTKEELVRYKLSENYAGKTALITAEITRKDGHWSFKAVGTGTNDNSIEEVARRYK